MKTLYFDIFSGISGDMFIGALIDLGVDPAKLERELRKLKLDGYHLHVARRKKSGIEGVKFDVHMAEEHDHHHEHRNEESDAAHHDHHHHHDHDDNRTFAEIKKLISGSKLSAWVKQRSIAVFRRIADAEGGIHGMSAEKVHFHEVGAIDSIVDIVGGCIALELLGKPRVLSAPVVEGMGWVDCAHGRFPIPAPATLAILGARGIAMSQCEEPHELVTPTGAALLAEFAEEFQPMSGVIAEQIGFGLGTRENKTRPNVLRAVLGRTGVSPVLNSRSTKPETGRRSPHNPNWETDRVAVLETNLDDINSEVLGHFMEKAFAAGALDVFHTAIQMKKNRPGILLTVLCGEADSNKFSEMILRETSAFGVRQTIAERRKLKREFRKVKTKFGDISVKLGKLGVEIVQAAPEYESCKKAAEKMKVPLKLVYDAAIKAAKL